MTIDQSRLAQAMNWSIKSGGHEPDQIQNGEACVMEIAAYVAGLPLSDEPDCTCRVIGAFLRSWNDSLPNDAERDRLLKPLITEIIGTRSTPAVEDRRSYMALDWLIRVHTPAWLDRVESLKTHAIALRDHEEIADLAGAVAAGEKVRAARDAARAAACDAAWGAARAAACDAACDAAWAAARDAARAAAWGALKPTVDQLQQSALDLVRRMIAVQP